MKFKGLLLIAVLIIASLAFIYLQRINQEANAKVNEFYLGVSFGGQSVQEAIVLIDKVKNYTNMLLINSYDLTTNQSALNEVCDYAAQASLKFVVYFDFISRIIYPWHQTWLDMAKERWGDKLLGIHLSDEPGGKQIEMSNNTVSSAKDYSDAANQFVAQLSSSNSSIDAKRRAIPLFTSDFALYWWDYLSGYDTVFVELGWKLNSTQQIALCRGAANMKGKDWGAIIVWTYYEPPYLASAQEVYDNMVLGYQAGAKYVVVFNYPTYPKDNPYGILSQEHFEAITQFWTYVNANPRGNSQRVVGEVALVLPKDYGWGMRRNEYITQDRIWGLWPEDERAPLILENTNKLLANYGLKLDIVYDDERFDYKSKYAKTFYWNYT